jgi:hypothetical protein
MKAALEVRTAKGAAYVSILTVTAMAEMVWVINMNIKKQTTCHTHQYDYNVATKIEAFPFRWCPIVTAVDAEGCAPEQIAGTYFVVV